MRPRVIAPRPRRIFEHIEMLCESLDRSTVKRRWENAIQRVMKFNLSREQSVEFLMNQLREREKFRQDTELTIQIVKNWK